MSAPATNARPAPGQQHGADVVPRACLVDRDAELAHQGVVQRVQLVGPIHGDRRDAVGDSNVRSS
jgi:hypothetical protein